LEGGWRAEEAAAFVRSHPSSITHYTTIMMCVAVESNWMD